jgi:excisionase family DNA binding protein
MSRHLGQLFPFFYYFGTLVVGKLCQTQGGVALVNAEEYLTVAQAAKRLQVHPETVRRMLSQGRLKGHRPGSDKFGWRIPASEIERFLSGTEQDA